MNNNIVSQIDALKTELAELREKDPRAYLELLQQLNGALVDLNEEFKELKKASTQ